MALVDGKILLNNYHWLLRKMAACLKRGRRANLSRFSSPVAFICNGIGDHLVALPALRALASLFPDQLTVLYRRECLCPIFEGIPLRKKVRLAMLGPRFPLGRFDAARAARDVGHADLLLSFSLSHSPDLVPLLEMLSPQQSIGFQPYFTDSLNPNLDINAVDLAFLVAQTLDASLELMKFVNKLPLPPNSLEPITRFKASLPQGTKILAVHLDTIPRKMWSSRRSADAINRFLDSHREFVAVLVGNTPHPLASELGERVIPWHGMPLITSMQMVARSDLFLGVDSCFLHAADFCRKPGVGLFGPTRALKWGFRIGPGIAIQGPGVMDGITVEEVVGALESALSSARGSVSNTEGF